MEPWRFWIDLAVILTLSASLSLAFPPQSNTQDAGRAALAVHQELQAPLEGRERMNTVRVTCHPNMLEITVKADLFGVGAPVHSEELHLGVENYNFCRAVAASADEYRIAVGLEDCGTKHWMTEDALIYTNLLIFSPLVSPDGLVRMDEAVIPVECHYKRKYSLSSSSLAPTWIPFMSTQAAVETLEFDLRIMTTDWLYERSSNVFYLGESVGLEASVKVGHHMGLRVFMSSCVATLYPDIYSVPKYLFLENGCLVDSQLSDSRSQFLPRIQDDKLHLVIDAFKFHNEDKGQLYITCHLTAVPVNDLQNKACTFINGRWRSADGNDYLCSSCPGQSPSNQGKFGPRGFEKPAESEAQWMSGPKVPTVWEQEARVGPVVVLPGMQKSGPVEEIPPVLTKISRPALYGSKWRSGINDKGVDLEKGLIPDLPSTLEQLLEEDEDDGSEVDLKDAEGDFAVNVEKSQEEGLDSDGGLSTLKLDRMTLSNATVESGTEHDPKK